MMPLMIESRTRAACCRWYTLCGAKHPQQGTPDCNVESKFYETFNQIAKLNPKVTNIIYLNSMFDFVSSHPLLAVGGCMPALMLDAVAGGVQLAWPNDGIRGRWQAGFLA